jgi:hypothetical protein
MMFRRSFVAQTFIELLLYARNCSWSKEVPIVWRGVGH